MPKPNTLKTTYHIWAVYGDSEARIFLTQEIESPANKHTQRKKKTWTNTYTSEKENRFVITITELERDRPIRRREEQFS